MRNLERNLRCIPLKMRNFLAESGGGQGEHRSVSRRPAHHASCPVPGGLGLAFEAWESIKPDPTPASSPPDPTPPPLRAPGSDCSAAPRPPRGRSEEHT